MHDVDDWIRYGDELRRPLGLAQKAPESTKLVIVGGGLSGLCVAYRIATKRPDIEIVLVEASDRLGGVISTWNHEGWVCDLAVNATRPHPAFWRLISDLGLEQDFRPSNTDAKSRWIRLNGRQHRLSATTALKIGPFKLWRSMRRGREGGQSVRSVLPHPQIADAMTLGIVNAPSDLVDADFLFPSMTRFGPSPPQKWSAIKRSMRATYPLFTPRRGSIASLKGGMESLIARLGEKVSNLPNVSILLNKEMTAPQAAAKDQGVPLHSVIWTGPIEQDDVQHRLSVFAAGYRQEDVGHVPIGYGSLIPDPSVPISGVLHESDVHASPRAPQGHRLFRLMVPHSRWDGDEESIKQASKLLLTSSEPVVFENLGTRAVPSYPPGYLASLQPSSLQYSRAGWFYSGVSITHVVAEAERMADAF